MNETCSCGARFEATILPQYGNESTNGETFRALENWRSRHDVCRAKTPTYDPLEFIREIAALHPSPESPIGEMARATLRRHEAEKNERKERDDDAEQRQS